MRITVRIPDDLGEEVKSRTNNVSAYVQEALSDKLKLEKRRQALNRIRRHMGTANVPDNIHEIIQRERREGDRDFSSE